MNQQEFEHKKQAAWTDFELQIRELEEGRNTPSDLKNIPSRFRQICGDLALAESRMYNLRMLDYLNQLVIRGLNVMQSGASKGLGGISHFLLVKFPIALRREWKLFWLCSAFFFIPFFLMMFAANSSQPWIESILGSSGMQQMDEMYGPGKSVEDLRNRFGSDFMMFAYYIMNNIGIDFRAFSGGILGGFGTLVILLFNGFYLGAAAGYVNMAGDPVVFWSFVSGHSSWELLGIVISGMSGMRLGLAIINPGSYRRPDALREAAKSSVSLILGAAAMTFVAALIEGFWSASPQPPILKYSVGIFFWIVVAFYLIFAGRKHEA
jgi:uncharacterized membrane protein SpoIIM required for sporulation